MVNSRMQKKPSPIVIAGFIVAVLAAPFIGRYGWILTILIVVGGIGALIGNERLTKAQTALNTGGNSLMKLGCALTLLITIPLILIALFLF
ncbi:MAG: hypothetical protein G01um101438_948 [Parcubacteria group bacterium Gr01-1014_38]|nr:MAG: hypothetical protein G01um101438_948 [Parcubacteria group bacterium Gr01-1014_38]